MYSKIEKKNSTVRQTKHTSARRGGLAIMSAVRAVSANGCLVSDPDNIRTNALRLISWTDKRIRRYPV